MDKQSENIAVNMEENLYAFYHLVAQVGEMPHEINEDYSWVNASPYSWPGFVFNFTRNEDKQAECLMKIQNEIDKGIVPPLLIVRVEPKANCFSELAAAHKFRLVMQWPGMAIHLDDIKLSFDARKNFELIEISSASQLFSWIEITEKCLFKGKKQHTEMFMKIMTNRKVKFILGIYEHEPVATAVLFIDKGIAGIYMVSTLPEFRKKGLSSNLLLYGLFLAQKNNCHLAVLQANNLSKTLYEKIGFQEHCQFEIYWKIPAL
jgi:hypothetical protein